MENGYSGTGNLAQDPLLQALANNGGFTQTMAPLVASPAINTGDDTNCPETDQRGVARPQAGHCDIGAYEAQYVLANPIHVYWNATGTNDGSSWENAFTDLQAALRVASSGNEIWVAAGTYKPTASINRSISFSLKNDVSIYGGFSGTEALRTQRDYSTNVTILSGDIGIEGSNGDNSYQVVRGMDIGNTAILDGFTITASNANGPAPYDNGGGMYNDNSSPTLTNLIFSNHSAIYGGGMINWYNSNPILTNVIFSGNFAETGSGMVNHSSSPSLNNVTFSHNIGGTGSIGGAMVNDLNSSPSLTNVSFINNSVNSFGGGMLNSFNSNPILVNVTFSGNSSVDGGGAIYNSDSDPILKNVTISGNTSNIGGAIYNNVDSNPSIINSILYGNTGGEIYNNSGTAVVTYSIVQGGYPGTGNLDANPLLGPLQNNGGFTETMALLPGSPAIDAASDAFCPSTDQRGVVRSQGSHCDIGAYEVEGPITTPTLTPSPTNTATSTFTATNTPTFTPTFTLTFMPTSTPTFTSSPTNIPLPSNTPTSTPTSTGKRTSTPTPMPPNTPTRTDTPPPPTATFTPTNTARLQTHLRHLRLPRRHIQQPPPLRQLQALQPPSRPLAFWISSTVPMVESGVIGLGSPPRSISRPSNWMWFPAVRIPTSCGRILPLEPTKRSTSS